MKLMAAGVFVLKKRYFPLAVALCASLLLHGLLVAELLGSYAPGKNGMASTPAKLQVVILAPAVAPQAINAPTTQAARPEKEPLPRRIPATRNIPRAPTPERSIATTAAAAVAEIPAAPAFVLPFTPPTSSPLGRGSWGMASAPQVHPQNGQFRIEQARAQFRAQLMDRLSTWVARQAQQHKEVRCLIRLNLDTRQTGLSCTPIEAEAEVWSLLVGLATAVPVIEGDTTCLRAGTDQLGMVACEDKAGP
jgi:hypothetical protein